MSESLYSAVEAFMGPLMAAGCRVIEEGPDDMPITVTFGPCEVTLTLAALKRLDDAHASAQRKRWSAAQRKSKGSLL